VSAGKLTWARFPWAHAQGYNRKS